MYAKDHKLGKLFEIHVNETCVGTHVVEDLVLHRIRLCTPHPSWHALFVWIVHGGGLMDLMDGQVDVTTRTLDVLLFAYIRKLCVNDHVMVKVLENYLERSCGKSFVLDEFLHRKNELSTLHLPYGIPHSSLPELFVWKRPRNGLMRYCLMDMNFNAFYVLIVKKA